MALESATSIPMPGPISRAREFLTSRRIALVGFSRNPKDFSRVLDGEFRRLGIEVVPVHPSEAEVDGRRCFPRVADIAPPVDGALILVPAASAEGVALDCLDAGVRRIWFHRGGGPGSGSPEAVALCRARGVAPVSDLCPFMVISGASWPHRLHGWFRVRKLQK
jgi:predicted CoA-binding protein